MQYDFGKLLLWLKIYFFGEIAECKSNTFMFGCIKIISELLVSRYQLTVSVFK